MNSSKDFRAPTIDGLVFSCDGWSDALRNSGLSAMHVTVGDFLGDFAATCSGIARWNHIIERDSTDLYQIRSPSELLDTGRRPGTGVIFGLQNAAPIGTDLSRIEELWQLGVRVMQLTYNHANAVGDGCLEMRDAGLTNFGRQVVRECNRVGMVVDLSHVGERSTLDAVEVSQQPVVATHANIRELAPTLRNKSERVLAAIVESGGYVGVSPYGPMCWDGFSPELPTSDDFLRQVQRATELFGPESVGIGTDYGIANDMAAIDALLARSVDRFPEIFEAYAKQFGNDLSSRYCESLDSVAAWSSFPGLLSRVGMDEKARARLLGGTLAEKFAQIWGAREPT